MGNSNKKSANLEKPCSSNNIRNVINFENLEKADPIYPKCPFHCPHPDHKSFSLKTQCILEEGHVTSVLFFDHKFECLHEDLRAPKIQILFICEAKFSIFPIVKNVMSLLGKHLEDTMKLYPEFAFILYKDHHFGSDNVVKYIDFSPEKLVKDFINEVQNEVLEDVFFTKNAVFHGIETALKLSWARNGEHFAILLNNPPILSEDKSTDEEPPACSCDLQLDKLWKKCQNKNINFFVIKKESQGEEFERVFGNKLTTMIRIFDFDGFPGNLLVYLRQVLRANKFQLQKKIICFEKKINQIIISHFHDAQKYDNEEQMVETIENSLYEFIVIIGTNGEGLVKLIHDHRNVLGIVVFCNNLEFHQKWMKSYAKIHFVTFREKDFYKEVLNLKTSYCAYYTSNPIAELAIEDNVDMGFWRILLNYLKIRRDHQNINNEEIEKELVNLNSDEKINIIQIFNQKNEEILKAILFLISTDYLKQNFHEMLSKKNYKKILWSLTTIANEIINNEKYSNQIHKPKGLVYKGITNSKHTLNDFREFRLRKKKPLFFSGFVNATCDLDKAKEASDGIIFELHFSEKNPHPHIILENEEWSQTAKEKETLIYPYFPFNVEKIVILEEKFKIITLVQEPEINIFSRDMNEMKEFWNSMIKNTLLNEYKDMNIKKNVIDDILDTIDIWAYPDEEITEKLREIVAVITIVPFNIKISLEEFTLDVKGDIFWDSIRHPQSISMDIKNYFDLFKNLDKIAQVFSLKTKISLSKMYLDCAFFTKISTLISPLKDIYDLTLKGISINIVTFLNINKLKFSNLEKLEISSLNSEDIEILTIFHDSKIKFLSITFNHLENAITNYLNFLQSLKHLENLKLCIDFRLDLETVLSINKSLKELQNLKSLTFELELWSLTPFIKIFADTFSKLTNLNHLSLNYCNAYLYDTDVKFLLNAIGNLKNLKMLEISPKKNFFDLLAPEQNFENLTSLYLKTHYDFEQRFAKMDFLTNLRELVIPNFIEGSNENLQIAKFTNLEKFIYKTKINQNDRFMKIFSEITKLPKLTYLDLSVEIGADFNLDSVNFSKTVNENLEGLNSLKTLSLELISSIKLKFSVGKFAKLENLEKLSMNFFGLKIDDILMEKNDSLVEFNLSLEHCSDEIQWDVLKKMTNFLSNCKNLKFLNLISINNFDLPSFSCLENLELVEILNVTIFLKEETILNFKEMKLPKNIINFDLFMRYSSKQNKKNDHFLKNFLKAFTQAKKLKKLKLNIREVHVKFDIFVEALEKMLKKKDEDSLEILELEVTLEEMNVTKNYFLENMRRIFTLLQGLIKFDLNIHFVSSPQMMALILDKNAIENCIGDTSSKYEVETIPQYKHLLIKRKIY